MDILTFQVDCRPYARDGPPQLGITVEAPYSQHRSKKQTAATKDHDYQNLDNCTTVYDGLQITKIQPGSIIDRNGQFKVGDVIAECNGVNLQRPFAEAQRTLKQFVVEHTSQKPLIMKVLRKAMSSSSIPSTSGSQTTVIEKDKFPLQNLSQSSKPKTQSMPQQVLQSISATPSLKTAISPPSKPSRHLLEAFTTRKKSVQHTIKLKKGPEGGFGIKIAERDNMHCAKNKPICVTAILVNGAAHRDGRLQEGDILLRINGYDLEGVPQHEVTRTLRAVGIDQIVEFVISRQEAASQGEEIQDAKDSSRNSIYNDCDKSLIDLSVPEQDDSVFESSSNQQFERKIDSLLNIPTCDGPGIYEYDIPLNDTKSAGLGLYLKYPRRADELKDLGIWIEKVITGGAAWKDGRLQPDDQILGINGINLVGLSNAEASDTLTAAVVRGIGPEATPNTIRLKIHRRDPFVVAKILQGTNNRIECSDVMTSNKPVSIFDTTVENSCESYQTAFESNNQKVTIDSRDSSETSNQTSQNDSAISNHIQASNPIKLSNPYQRSTDETTSGAISPITNSVSIVPTMDITESNFHEQDCNTQSATLPKSIYTDINDDLRIVDCTSSSLSLDDESLDANAVDHFQRDGYSRRSMSEKKHAQLSAETDTFRRNQLLRKEREQQRQLEEQLARQRLDDDRRRSYQQVNQIQKLPQSYTANEFRTIYGSHTKSDQLALPDHKVADSITSTSNDECYLINSNNNNIKNNNNNIHVDNTTSTHKKSSSLLSKFLKFGSMKRRKKATTEQPTQTHLAQQSTSKQSHDNRRNQTSNLNHSSQQVRHNNVHEKNMSQSMGLTVRPVDETHFEPNSRVMIPSPQAQYSRYQTQQQSMIQVPRAGPSMIDMNQHHQPQYLGPSATQILPQPQYDLSRQTQYSNEQRFSDPVLPHGYGGQVAPTLSRPSGHWSNDLEVLEQDQLVGEAPNEQLAPVMTTAQQFMKHQIQHHQNHLPQHSIYQRQPVHQHFQSNHNLVDAQQPQISLATQFSPQRQNQFANQLDQLIVMPSGQQVVSQHLALRQQVPITHARLSHAQQSLAYLPNRPPQPPRYHCPVGHQINSLQHMQHVHMINQQQPGYQNQLLRGSHQPQSQPLYNTLGNRTQQPIQPSQSQLYQPSQQQLQYSLGSQPNTIYSNHQNGVPIDSSGRRFQTLPPLLQQSNTNGIMMQDKSRIIGETVKSSEFYIY